MPGTLSVSTASAVAASTTDPAFVTDSTGKIRAWNDAVQHLLGYDEEEALGKHCYALLGGRDIYGNRYCSAHCPLLGMAVRNEPVGHLEFHVQSAGGEMIRVRVTVLVVPSSASSDCAIVHVLTPVSESTGARAAPPVARTKGLDRLTSRELEVLRLLADGQGTNEIGELLFISAATVRSHVQNLLRKLGVHSRLEAVAVMRGTRPI